MSFAMDDYVDVAERIRLVKEKYPDAVFQPSNPAEPYKIIEVGGTTFIVYTAALYRDPFDACPAIACAWEEVPGRTPYTKGSELMNAETSAWGRCAIALGIPSKKIASMEEVKARVNVPKQAETVAVQALPTPKTEREQYDPWAAPLSEPIDESVAPILDAWHCIHGERKTIEGEKNGKAYFGMGCPKTINSGEQCKTHWFVLNAEGSWVPKIESVK
jgi:hypothetical protein